MKKILFSLVSCAILAICITFVGTKSVSAAPASPEKGSGCAVTANGINYFFDNTCSYHVDFKFDDAGNLQFYHYQDQSRLPEGVARPSRVINNSYEACYNFDIGYTCGTVHETVTPGGVYKSSFKAY